MTKILALVEGHTEAQFFEMAHPQCKVLRPFPNGVTVSLDKIAEKIEISLRAFSGEYGHIAILLDRERRDVSAVHIEAELKQRLALICPNRKFYIGVSDIQIENWMIADESRMRERFKSSDYSYPGDGANAKRMLRTLSKGESLSPRSKAELLKSCNANEIRVRSPSFMSFWDAVAFDWYWLRKEAA